MRYRRGTARTPVVWGAVAAALGALVTVGWGAPGASAAPAARAAHRTVTSGNARFEVLSPTLIRTEYAGDTQFVDAGTFNAVGRDTFPATPYTTSTSGGWLTVKTSAVTLKYKVNSGPFSGQNLTVALKAGGQQVTASPWQPPSTCAFATLCEAERQSLSALSVADDHTGYTGTGFAAGFTTTGSTLSTVVTVPAAGTYQFDLRYANSQGGDGQNTTRSLSLAADGGSAQQVNLPTTADWNTWAVGTASVTLPAGTHTLALTRASADSGNVNVDSVALVQPGASFPGPGASAAQPCAYGTVCDAESGTQTGGASLAFDHNGYAGFGFVAGLNQGAGDTVHLTGVPSGGAYALQVRYANSLGGDGRSVPRTLAVSAGGTTTTATLPTTSTWDTWRTATIPVTLTAGADDITLGCPDAASCHVNLDTVAVAATGSPVLAPHAPLGGYRRGLDGVNAAASDPATTAGLLYQDGWSLLDDTTSALYAPATQAITARPGHGGLPYQDGYVFGYGHDYARGLADLATLTGPSELLPRWAYGVWYSEYYDRTAAQYEDTILPKFRSDGVPLDVLVTDTDFKSQDTWNGWEPDAAKFPDFKGFLDWSAAQGLHNTFNIHSSIDATDPQYPQAQATAHNKLTGSNGRYVFDWGDPDQLKAYMDLHQSMEQQGADFWWLDWCCDDSYSSLPGVTPDAWINQQYASDTDKTVGRGFAFSRAYGSLQAGGYSGQAGLPTGPWADKRTTVHFTGDTTSNWATLAMEVGYTPGESAATGLSAVSHDIGGFNNDGTQTAGAEPGSTKEADDLYARWVQLGTFQPVDRLHGNHSDRLPWQYGTAARTSAEKFLNLRENLVPYTYTLAHQATTTGVPVVRPLYLQYPEEQDAYAAAGSEYLYGPDVLVAPVTTPGTASTTSVWFPPGSTWTDWFTGKTYTGGTTQDVATTLDTMPVFVRSGGIVATRGANVTNGVQNPLTKVTLDVAPGRNGSFALYEDNGQDKSYESGKSATTPVTYADGTRTVTIGPRRGTYPGAVATRTWTVRLHGQATAPGPVTVNGSPATATYDATTRTATVTTAALNPGSALTITFH
ncbi:TIM-barrel domain-containing protein [Streptomyces sp. NPDC051976]|uniref:TIM-barrel domain-containing protein n=1 Tax=Streptomyces sp. NPDC051976 TaxID=3154947 RepID=UPI00343859D5